MSHATDGELHAYLDGALQELDRERADDLEAHLRLCADCRARLDDARQIRGQAGEILSSIAPGSIEAPPFEEIEAAAAARMDGATDGEDRSDAVVGAWASRPSSWALGRMAGLAWAASVAFALAVGWQGRQLLRSPAQSDAIAVNERLQAPSVEATDADANRSAELGAEPSGSYLDDTESTEESVGGKLESGQGERAEAFKRDATVSDEPADARSNELAVRARQGQVRGAPPEAPAAAEREAAAEPSPGLDVFSDRKAGEGGRTWLSVDVPDAEHWLGSPILSVPEVPVEEVAISARDGERLVRVRQRLESGLLVELFEARDPAEGQVGGSRLLDELQAEEQSNARSFASVRRGGLRITALAQLASDSLRSLLSRLR
jgi:hypothetical protein